MEFVSIRDLRTRPADIWAKLRQQQDLILTANGKPIAILAGVDETQIEETLVALHRARAQAALSRLRKDVAARGLDRLSMDEIDAEIADARTERAQ
jgi:antitoxin (DNA-binding transcriptional repressor) of toxin-antitoxin stability system